MNKKEAGVCPLPIRILAPIRVGRRDWAAGPRTWARTRCRPHHCRVSWRAHWRVRGASAEKGGGRASAASQACPLFSPGRVVSCSAHHPTPTPTLLHAVQVGTTAGFPRIAPGCRAHRSNGVGGKMTDKTCAVSWRACDWRMYRRTGDPCALSMQDLSGAADDCSLCMTNIPECR